jgi:ATP-dependent RNA helicase MSS116
MMMLQRSLLVALSSSRRPPRVRPHKPSSSSDASPPNDNNNNPSEDDALLPTREQHQHHEIAPTNHKKHEQALQDPTLLTSLKFTDIPSIHPLTLRAITQDMGIQLMTNVQAQTFKVAINGTSIMAQSKTGSGKTIAFLLPSIQRLLERDYALYKPGKSIGIIIIAPTRELVIQITDQAETLLKYHPNVNVISLYGGVKLKRDIRLLTDGQTNPRLPSIVVSTPGRLLEHLESNTRIGRQKFVDIVDETQIVVLDETDRLFESHQKELTKILSYFKRASK